MSSNQLLLKCLACLLGILLCATRVFASDTRTFVIGVEDYPNFLPYSAYQNGEYSGLGKDILDEFARQRGYVFEYRVLPLKRRDHLFVEGKLDFIFPDNPLWVRELKQSKVVHYAPMLEFVDGTLVLSENVGKGITHIKRLGVPLGFTPVAYYPFIERGEMKMEEWPDYDSLYQGLIKKRLDAAYMNTRIASHYWRHQMQQPSSPVVADTSLPYIEDYWHLSSIRHPEVIAEFHRFLDENPELIAAFKKRYAFD